MNPIQRLAEKLGAHNREGRIGVFLQFIKFGLVGLSNTAITFVVEMLGYYVLFSKVLWPERVRILVVTALAFFVSVINSYYWNQKYVFPEGTHKTPGAHFLTFLKMTASYALTGLLLAPLLKVWIHEAGAAYWLASLLTLIVTVPLNYLLNKLWSFRTK